MRNLGLIIIFQYLPSPFCTTLAFNCEFVILSLLMYQIFPLFPFFPQIFPCFFDKKHLVTSDNRAVRLNSKMTALKSSVGKINAKIQIKYILIPSTRQLFKGHNHTKEETLLSLIVCFEKKLHSYKNREKCSLLFHDCAC